MDALQRMVGSVTALGAALIALAVGAAGSMLLATPWIAVPLLAAGVGQAGIAVLALRGGRLPVTTVLAPLAVPTLVWLGTLALTPEAATGLPLGPMLAETALALVSAALLARPLRGRDRGEPGPLAALLSLTAAAGIVAAVATMALAGTEAGRFAVPHGEHGGHGAEQHQEDTPGDDEPMLDESLFDEHGHH